MNEKCVHIWDFDFQTFFCKVLGTKIYRVNVGHTNSHEWEEYTFVANSRKFFGKKIQIKLCATEMIIIIIMAIMIIK